MKYKLSICIPARNEMWLNHTIKDILKNKEEATEIIVGLDGQWGTEPIPQHEDVTVLFYPESIGQRAMCNRCVSLSKAKYVMKCDAHCSFDKGFDRKLIEDMDDNWTVVPAMKNLHVFDWVCECGFRKYQGPTIPCPECGKEMKKDVKWFAKPSPYSTSYRFNNQLEFKYFGEYKAKQKGDIVDTMSLQGSCFMLTREKYWELKICDESWGSWGGQGSEISCKSRLSGMEVKVNKKTWYAHLFRTQGGDFGFPYKNPGSEQKKAKDTLRDTFLNNKWEKQVFPLSKIIDDFYPIPDWSDEDIKELKLKEMKVHRPGIYSILNIENNKIYIGSSTDIARRFIEHQVDLKNGKHENKHLQASWDKYGENKFQFNIEMFCPEEELIFTEQFFIDKYKEVIGWREMFNMQPTAHSSLGYKHTDEAKEKCGRNMKGEKNPFYGKTHTDESKEKLSSSLQGNIPWNKGKEWSDEVKNKISESQKGKTSWCKGLTKETDDRVKGISDKTKGVNKWENKEHPRGMLGKKHSEETKNKIRETTKKNVEKRLRDSSGHFISKPTKGIIFYTDNKLNLKIAHKVQKRLKKIGLPITSTSLKPMNFGNNIVVKGKRGIETYYKQIITALENAKEDIIFFCEHDVLYNPSHFEFTPPDRNKFYFNTNVWKVDWETGKGLWVDDLQQVSGIVCYREFALKYYKEKSKNRHFEPNPRENFKSKEPIYDIRHNNNLTPNRWKKGDFKNKKYTKGWKVKNIWQNGN